MKYLKEYNTVEEYIEDASSNPISYPTLTRVASDSNWGKKMFYRKVMTDQSNPEAMSIARSAGWVRPNDTYMTLDQALAVTDETFQNANVQVEDANAYNGYTSTFSELKHFDEFQYFLNVKNLTRVKVSDDPYTAKGAFMCAYNLKSIKLPPQMMILGNVAFRWCEKLTDMELPSSVKQISSYCFYDCKNLTHFKFNTGLNVIQDCAFAHTNIGHDTEPVELPETLTYIGRNALSYDNWYFKFKETLNLPRIRLFGAENFLNQAGPRHLIMGENLATLGVGDHEYTQHYNDVFWGMLETVTIDENCPNFKSINNVVYTKDGKYCYGGADYGCACQEVLEIEEGCEKIVSGAFRTLFSNADGTEYCPWFSEENMILKRIVLPSTLTQIGYCCFQYSKPMDVVVKAVTPPTRLYYALQNGIKNIYVPDESVEQYKTDWSYAANKIKPMSELPAL